MKHLSMLTLFLSLSFFLNAQDRGMKKMEKLESMKIAFISEKVDFTPKEAQLFWPIYNNYSDELKALRKSLDINKGHSKDMTDSDAKKLISSKIVMEKEKTKILEKFIADLEGVISPQKTLRLLHIEQEFKSKMLKKVREKMENREQRKRPNN